MKKKKFTDSQILRILKEYENGVSARELARKHGFYFQTLYSWKERFSGVENVSQLSKLKDLEAENTRLKKMYANLSLENEALKDVLSKKW
ncbi:MAG: transposase [Flavobacteriales bacterium]|nr:transposase [Flavobacteriales bacterium]